MLTASVLCLALAVAPPAEKWSDEPAPPEGTATEPKWSDEPTATDLKPLDAKAAPPGAVTSTGGAAAPVDQPATGPADSEADEGAPAAVNPLRYDVGAGVLAALDAQGLAAGGRIDAGVGGQRWRATASVSAAGERAVALGEGRALYHGGAVALGPGLRLSASAWRFDLAVQAGLGLLWLRGAGVARPRSVTLTDLVIGGGARAGRRLGPALLFVQLFVWGWVGTPGVDLGGTVPATATLPAVDLELSVGAAFGRF